MSTITIANRRPMQARTIDAVAREAARLGGVACPVFNNGKIDEVHLFKNQQLVASIFVPITGRASVCGAVMRIKSAQTPPLRPSGAPWTPSENTHVAYEKPSKSAANHAAG